MFSAESTSSNHLNAVTIFDFRCVYDAVENFSSLWCLWWRLLTILRPSQASQGARRACQKWGNLWKWHPKVLVEQSSAHKAFKAAKMVPNATKKCFHNPKSVLEMDPKTCKHSNFKIMVAPDLLRCRSFDLWIHVQRNVFNFCTLK